MNPVLRELQRQLNDIAKQLDALQRQETVLSNPVTYSGTPTAGAVAYWTGAGTVAHASFGTAEVVRTSGDQTATGTKTFSDGLQVGGDGSFGSLLEVIGTGSDIASFEVDGTFARVYFVSYRESALTHGEFKGRAARGSKASPSAIQSGDLLFAIRAEGYGTNAWPGGNTAEVSLEADGAHTNTSQPGRIVFKTAKSGATGSTEAMRIDSSQNVTFAENVTVGANTVARNVQSLSFTMADDELVDLVATYGIPDSCMLLYTITNTVAGYSSIVGCRALASGYCEVVGTANSANITVGTTELTNNAGATPGTDGDVNISASSNGKIIIKNRLGGNRTFNILVVG